jgi:hypothetical protein
VLEARAKERQRAEMGEAERLRAELEEVRQVAREGRAGEGSVLLRYPHAACGAPPGWPGTPAAGSTGGIRPQQDPLVGSRAATREEVRAAARRDRVTRQHTGPGGEARGISRGPFSMPGS